MSATASRASNVFFSDDLPEASCSTRHLAYPVTANLKPGEAPVACGSTPTRVHGSARRGVLFSHRNDTRYFHSADSIYPSPPKSDAGSSSAPPPSIRSYLHEQDQNLPDSPYTTPLIARTSLKPVSTSSTSTSSPPALARSILKSRAAQILLAASVEEGTLNNKEAARLLVCGKRPRLIARDSFQLAMMRKAGGTEGVSSGKGKERAVDEAAVPGSDDSAASDGNGEIQLAGEDNDDESEEEEVVEADGALMTGSLVDIILNGAEDLLTLEEAYTTLTHRLRLRLAPGSIAQDLAPSSDEAIRIAIQPIKDEASAVVRALQRDLGRLLGRMPNSEWTSSDRESSPFRGLQAVRGQTDPSTSRPTPSPPRGGLKSPEPRQGYTEAEVRYRREASGVGGSALRFLALLLHASQLYQCFSDADLAALLDQAMIIPRTPKMPTPNAKRTYYLSIVLLAQMRIPAAAVIPAKDKIVRAVEAAVTDTLGIAGPNGGKDGQSQIRKEGFHAIINLLSTYPNLFLPHYTDLLPPAIKGMSRPLRETRDKAAAACAAFASAKIHLLYTTRSAVLESPNSQTKEEWSKAKILAQKLEFFVVAHLKSGLKAPGKVGVIYGHNGEKKTEANGLEQIFKDTIGVAEGVLWACAAWSTVITLMGAAYATSGLTGVFDHIMDRSLQPSNNTTRPLLARTAWNQAIHAYLSSGMVSTLDDDNRLIRSYKPFQSTGTQDSTERLNLIQLPLNLALGMANAPSAAHRVLQPSTEGQPAHYVWQRKEKSKRFSWMVTCGLSATSVVYAYSGIALNHRDQRSRATPRDSEVPSSDCGYLPEATETDLLLERLDQTWEKVVKPILSGLVVVQGVDQLKVLGWEILAAITAPAPTDGSSSPGEKWNLDLLLTHRYLSGQAFGIEKEAVVVDMLRQLEEDAIGPHQIPAWGAPWIVKHFDEMLDVFQAALIGVKGLASTTGNHFSGNDGAAQVLPVQLELIWRHLIAALATVQHDDEPTFSVAVGAVMNRLAVFWDLDPTTYLALELFGPDGCLTDLDAARISLITTLFEPAVDVLGPAALNQTPLSAPKAASRSGGDEKTTAVAIVLNHVLRSPALGLPLRAAPRDGLNNLVAKLLNLNSTALHGFKILGDISEALPAIFEADEETQLGIWRLVAAQWLQSINTQPGLPPVTTEPGPETSDDAGTLLVSLLILPFRQKAITSVWHSQATQEDLDVWKRLLEVAVRIFRVKGEESNAGVLDAVAGQLEEIFAANPRTNSSTISLSCLSSMLPQMIAATSLHDSKHVPVRLLAALSTSLFDSYPTPETLAAGTQFAISPAVQSTISALGFVLQEAPTWATGHILADALRSGIRIWLSDTSRVASDSLGTALDKLYCSTLSLLSRSIEAGDVPTTGDTLDAYIDIYAPRLSRAQSPEVVRQFQHFWRRCFEGKPIALSADARGFLQDVVAAVPGLINVIGLESVEWLDETESEKKFPHSQSLAQRALPAASSDAGPSAISSRPAEASVEIADSSVALQQDSPAKFPAAGEDELLTVAYPQDIEGPVVVDPDVRADLVAAQSAGISPALALVPASATHDLPLPADAPVSPSPNMSEADSERVEEQIEPGDVFGPPSLVTLPTKRRGQTSKKRALGPSQSAPQILKRVKIQSRSDNNTTVIPGTPRGTEKEDNDDDTDEEGDELAQPVPVPSILNRLLVKASTFGFFSPSRAKEAELVPASESASKRRRSQPGSIYDSRGSAKKRKVTTLNRGAGSRTAMPLSRTSSQTSSSSTSSAFRSGEVIVISDSEEETEQSDEEDEEEDELILSPETARQRRAEEDQDILQRSLLRASPIKPKRVSRQGSSRGRLRMTQVKAEVQATQGRYDDAPEDQTPQLPIRAAATAAVRSRQADPNLNPSPARTTQQARILSMIEEAATAKQAVESLDFDGVMRLLKHVNELRDAATANLQSRAVRERGSRR